MTDPKSVARHFTTEAFGPRDRIEACHEIYGRAIAKFDLEPPADDAHGRGGVRIFRASAWPR